MIMEKVAVIILNWNGKKDTLSCLSSLQKQTYKDIETIVVDNGSSDDSVTSIKNAFPDITLIETKKNLGFAGGNNVGLKYAKNKGIFDFFLLLNNDTIVEKNFISSFIKASNKKKNGGIFGAKILRFNQKNIIDHFGGFWNSDIAEFTTLGRDKDSSYYTDMHLVDYVCGCCFFIKKEVIEKIGFLEEKFFLIWEETDYCFQAKRNGFEIFSVNDAIVWHKISASFEGGKPHMHYYWWRNRLLWIERNCSSFEKKKLFQKTLKKEIIHLYKLKWLKQSLLFFSVFSPSYKTRKNKFLVYKAGVKGIQDYFHKRFGEGPKWLIKRKITL